KPLLLGGPTLNGFSGEIIARGKTTLSLRPSGRTVGGDNPAARGSTGCTLNLEKSKAKHLSITSSNSTNFLQPIAACRSIAQAASYQLKSGSSALVGASKGDGRGAQLYSVRPRLRTYPSIARPTCKVLTLDAFYRKRRQKIQTL